MNILFVDVETTGTDAERHAVIELAAQLYTDGKLVDEFQHQCFDKRGAKAISLGALKVNNNDLNALWNKPEENEAVIGLVAFLLKHKNIGPIIVAGQNVQFDVSFLKALLKKYGVEDLEQITGYKYVDTFTQGITLAQAGIIPKDSKLNLAGLAKALGIDTSNVQFHTAKGDVELTAKVYFRVIELLSSLYQNSLMAAVAQQG